MKFKGTYELDESEVREAIVNWLESMHDVRVEDSSNLKFDIVDSSRDDYYGPFKPAYIRKVSISV